jgi:hypothetical protein
MNFSLYSFLHPPATLSLFSPNILLDTLFTYTLSLCSSLTVRDHDSHPYRTAGKIIVLQPLVKKEDRSIRYQNTFNIPFKIFL